MKKTLTILSILLLFSISQYVFGQQPDTLTNEKIIKLYKAGFSKETLKSKIQNSSNSFDVSIEGMLELKKAGVPEDIINVMVTSNSAIVNNSQVSTAQNTGGINLASGIYYKDPSGNYLEIEPSVLTGSKSNNAAQLFISGLINAKIKATLSGKHSSFSIFEKAPKFIFVFDTTSKGNLNSDNNQWMTNARSPKEFLLVSLEVEKNSRQITVGKSNAVNSNSGIDDKYVILFNSKKLSNGIYEVEPQAALAQGEYCFMFAQGIRDGQSSKVFDLSIQPPKGF